MIDTLNVVEQLRESGFDEKQAKSIIQAIVSHGTQLATKQDIVGVKQDFVGVKQDVEGVRRDIEGIRRDIQGMRWLIGVSLVLHTLTISGIIAMLMSIAN